MTLREVSEVIDGYSGLSHRVLEYSLIMKRLVDGAKQPGVSAASWAPLADLVAVDKFDATGKIRHLDIYLQMALPESAMLGSYEGVDISG